MSTTSHVSVEIASQPQVWREAARLATESAAILPQPGERVAIVGCGTSWFIAQAYASRRESWARASRMPSRAASTRRTGSTTASWRSPAPGPRPRSCISSGCSTAAAHPRDRRRPDVARGHGRRRRGRDALRGRAVGRPDPLRDRRAHAAARRARRGHRVACGRRRGRRGLGDPRGGPGPLAVHVPGSGIRRGPGQRGRAEDARGLARLGRVLPAMDYRHGPISISDENSAVVLFGAEVPGWSRTSSARAPWWSVSTRTHSSRSCAASSSPSPTPSARAWTPTPRVT
ncbi:hypothetical protein NKG05_04110 [Oerskovia sp. M15]